MLSWLTSGVFMSFLLGSFVSLVTIINPLSAIPLFNALSSHLSDRDTEALARQASLYAFAILTISLFAGGLILSTFGISYAALRIAGGLVVARLGQGMLFDQDRPRNVGADSLAPRNPAFFPLALPGISGPGSIAVVIGLSTEISEVDKLGDSAQAWAATVVAVALSCLLVWLVLRSGRKISQRLGPNGIEVMTRLMGFLLVCIGVQFIASGVRTFVSGI